MDAETADKVRGYYEGDFAVTLFTAETGLYAIERAWLAKYFPPPPGAILDIACGAGRTTRPLADRGYEAHAVDISHRLLREGRKRHPDLSFIQMNAQKLGFKDNLFDAVLFSVQGIDHLVPCDARLECLREIFRVLRPGGVFLMSTHNLIGEALQPILRARPRYKQALQLLRWQLGNRHLAQWYARYVDEGGETLGYAAPPSWTRKQLERTGFLVRGVAGANWTPDWDIVETKNSFLRSTFVYFAAQKPTAE
jgi:ubiquinone/menaquinone biosynthesis C-methylase UbiE